MNLGNEEESPWDDVPSNSNPSTPLPTSNGDPLATTKPPTSSEPPRPAVTTSAPSKTPGGRGNRKKPAVPQTRLEAVEDPLGPLSGPTGEESAATQEEPDRPPALPQKEQRPLQSSSTAATSPSLAESQPRPAAPEDVQDQLAFRSREPQQGNFAGGAGLSRPAQQSLSIEQAARPSFYITVGDPHTVGDLTGSHTVYQVHTKTTSKAYRNAEFEVARRYRDFLWVYNQLHSNNPGVIVPPPPEKQAVGRFDTNFVESRRAALEKMLNKTAAHPLLQHDLDLKLFLESDSFTIESKNRERKDPEIAESKGMFSSLNLSVGSGTKFVEHDDWFLDRRVYLDTLESQLKALLKATDTAVAQRKALSEASSELSVSLSTLSQVELSPSLSGPLAGLSDLHLRIRDLYDRQAAHDVLTFGIVIDEYIRLIGSIKKAFEQRQNAWQGYHNAESDLGKRRSALDKLMRQGRTQTDKMNQLQADVADAERRAHQQRLQFDDLGRGMRAELERFEREKVEDFRMGLETYLESTIEAQKELIELWETYLMHLDADEEEELAAAAAKGAAPPQAAAQPASSTAAPQPAESKGAAVPADSEAPPAEQAPPPTASSTDS